MKKMTETIRVPALTDHAQYAEVLAKTNGIRAEISQLHRRRQEIAMNYDFNLGSMGTAEREAYDAEVQSLPKRILLLKNDLSAAEQELARVAGEASAELMEPLGPAFRDVTRRIALALLDLVAALRTQRRLSGELGERDIRVPAGFCMGLPLSVSQMFLLSGHGGAIEAFLLSSVERGILSLSEIKKAGAGEAFVQRASNAAVRAKAS